MSPFTDIAYHKKVCMATITVIQPRRKSGGSCDGDVYLLVCSFVCHWNAVAAQWQPLQPPPYVSF